MKKIKSSRLELEEITIKDFDFFKYYFSDSERTKYLPQGKPYSSNDVKIWLSDRISHWKKNNFGTFLIQEMDSEQTIGYCGLEFVMDSDFIDIRYGLIQDSWGKGYAQEAARACLSYGFHTIKLEIIYGAAISENIASINTLKKIGMQKDSNFIIYGNTVESYSISRDIFNSNL